MSKYHIVRLGELISPANVIKCGTNIYPVLSMTMHDGIVLQSNRFKKSLASLDTSEYKVVKEGQLVVGFPIDEGVLYIQHHSFEGIMSPAYDVYNVDYSRITGVYLESALHSPQSMQYYASKLRGTTARRRSIPKKDLFELPIILPDLATQKHITDIISYANKLIEICKSILEKTDTLVKSRFVEMFGDTEINSNDYPVYKLNDLCTVSSSKRFIPEEKYVELCNNDLVPKADDILITSRGTLGKCYIIQEKDKFYFQDGMISWLYNLDKCIIPLYISLLFDTRDIKRQIENLQSGSTVAYLSIAMLKKLNIVVPPLDLQKQFADFVAQTDKSKLAVKQILEKAETLKKSLMQEYFG